MQVYCTFNFFDKIHWFLRSEWITEEWSLYWSFISLWLILSWSIIMIYINITNIVLRSWKRKKTWIWKRSLYDWNASFKKWCFFQTILKFVLSRRIFPKYDDMFGTTKCPNPYWIKHILPWSYNNRPLIPKMSQNCCTRQMWTVPPSPEPLWVTLGMGKDPTQQPKIY